MSDAGGQDAASFCADLVRTHDFVRYASTLFVPATERRALLAIYAFNTEITRVHEQVSQPLPGEIRLQWWSDMLAGNGHGDVAGNPVAAELLLAVRNFGLPVEPLSRLIEEHQFDLYNDPMPTMAALEGYLDATASALFALAARVMARPSDAIDHLARHAGLAQGMAQVIAALPRAASRHQSFLPLQLLQQHGIGTQEVFAGRETPQLRAAINDLVEQATTHLETALSLLSAAPREARPVFLPLAMVQHDLSRMTRGVGDPFVPEMPTRLRILWKMWRMSRRPAFAG